MEENAIINFFNTIFQYIGKFFDLVGKIFGFIGNIIKGFFVFFYNSVELIASIFGVNNIAVKLIIAALYMIVLSIIPDLILYHSCKLSKKYRNLKTKEEKMEYCSKHAHFLLKAILIAKNKIVWLKSSKLAKKNKKTSEDSRTNDVLVEDIIDDLEQGTQISNNLGEDNVEEILPTFEGNETENEIRPNIKVLYSSNIIGNMMKNGVVLERKLLSGDKPVLIDFAGKPREVFTKHLCDEQSGIKFCKMFNGKKIEVFLDNPDLLRNSKLYEDLSKEDLEKLKEILLNDKNYQTSLKSFFTINDKTLAYKKS